MRLRNKDGDQPPSLPRENVRPLKELRKIRFERDGEVVLETRSYLLQHVASMIHRNLAARSAHGRWANRSIDGDSPRGGSEGDGRDGALGGVVQGERLDGP